jgi:hypothetical protein
MNYLIRDKDAFLQTLDQLKMPELVGVIEGNTVEDIFLRICETTEKEKIFEMMIKGLIEKRLCLILSDFAHFKITPSGKAEGQLFLDKKETLKLKTAIEKNVKWRLPSTVIRRKSYLFSLGVLLVWTSIVFTFFRRNIDLFLATFSLFSIVFLFAILLFPSFALALIAPSVFYQQKFVDVETFQDLIDEIYRLNALQYHMDNYKTLKEELYQLFGPF